MQWTDDGVVLGARRHGESSIILELMTRDHGRHLGLVHGGRSRKQQPMLQPGNTVHAVWRARLDEHLGSFQVEGGDMRAARFIASPLALYGLATVAALLRFLPERDPHPALYDTLTVLVDHLDDREIAPALFVRFEIAILAEFGFGLDLTRCAATGGFDDLVYVSPKSGRAVSRAAGLPYADRLLRLPPFLAAAQNRLEPGDVGDGLELTGRFLEQFVFGPLNRPLPPPRVWLIDKLRETGRL